MGHGPRTNRLEFGGDPDQNPEPGFLNQDADPESFRCPARLTSLSVQDISSSVIIVIYCYYKEILMTVYFKLKQTVVNLGFYNDGNPNI